MTTSSLAEAFVDSDREFWHGVLTGGGFTPIPRWTLDPVPGVAVCEVRHVRHFEVFHQDGARHRVRAIHGCLDFGALG